MRKFLISLVAATMFTAALPVGNTFAQDNSGKTIADIVVSMATAKDKPEFTTLLAIVKAADPAFLKELSDKNATLTVFAPTDAAFAASLKSMNLQAADVLKNQALLDEVLSYHIVSGVALDAATITADSGAVVGTVLDENVLSLKAAGGKVTINNANVVTADVKAVNGVVHVIDSVLLPADLTAPAATMAAPMATMSATMAAAPKSSIADLVVAAASAKDKPEFTTLLAAVKAANPAVLTALSTGGPFTVFAPTDAAFAAALKTLNLTADKLLADKGLTGILLYHVIPGHISAATLVAAIGTTGVKVVTLAGSVLSFNVKAGKVVINDGPTVVTTDVEADNGLVHVIDGVLLPPTK